MENINRRFKVDRPDGRRPCVNVAVVIVARWASDVYGTLPQAVLHGALSYSHVCVVHGMGDGSS